MANLLIDATGASLLAGPGPLVTAPPPLTSPITAEVASLAWMVEVDAVGLTLAGDGGPNPTPVVTTLRWSSVSFTTAPTDSPPNEAVQGRLAPGFDLTRELPTGQDGFGAFMDVAVGDLVLENDDQELDALPDTYSVAGRPCRIAFAAAAGLGRRDTSGLFAADWEDPSGNPVQWDVSGMAAVNASAQPVSVVNASAQAVSLVSQSFGAGPSGLEWDTTGGSGVGSAAGIGQFAYVFKGLVSSWSFAGGQVRLRLGPNAARLDQPITKNTYDGSGDLGGTADLKGRTKPYAFGQCNGVEPVLIDPFTLTYQYHDGGSAGLSDVRDEGLSLASFRDCSTYAELQALVQQGGAGDQAAWDIDIGAYALCSAEGVFRLGGTPAGRLIVDVRGAADFADERDPWDDGTPWADTTLWAAHRLTAYASGAMHSIFRLLTVFGGFADGEEVDGAQIDHLFGDTDGSFDPSSGLYVASGEQTTIRDAITRLAASVGVAIIQNRSGLWQARMLTIPASPTITATITDRHLEKGTLQRLDLPWAQPWSKWKVAYDRNWTVLGTNDLAGGSDSGSPGGSYVDPKIAVFSQREAAFAEAADPLLDLIWPEAKVSTVDGLVRNESRATEAAQRLLGFYAGPNRRRGLYQCTAHGVFGQVDLMDVVQLQTARIGIGTRDFVVVGHRDIGDDRSTELTLFG